MEREKRKDLMSSVGMPFTFDYTDKRLRVVN